MADGYQYQQLSDVNPYAAFWPPVDDMFMACAGNYTAYVYSGDPGRGLTVKLSILKFVHFLNFRDLRCKISTQFPDSKPH